MKAQTKKTFSNPHPDDPQAAFNRAARYLALRPRSVHEIEGYLLKKKFTPQATKSAITRLIDLKFLDDSEFGRAWIRNRQTHKGKSKYFIAYELKQKGLSEDLIQDLAHESQDDLETAKAFIARKKRVYAQLDKLAFREKMMRLLQSRGFSYDIIKKALD